MLVCPLVVSCIASRICSTCTGFWFPRWLFVWMLKPLIRTSERHAIFIRRSNIGITWFPVVFFMLMFVWCILWTCSEFLCHLMDVIATNFFHRKIPQRKRTRWKYSRKDWVHSRRIISWCIPYSQWYLNYELQYYEGVTTTSHLSHLFLINLVFLLSSWCNLLRANGRATIFSKDMWDESVMSQTDVTCEHWTLNALNFLITSAQTFHTLYPDYIQHPTQQEFQIHLDEILALSLSGSFAATTLFGICSVEIPIFYKRRTCSQQVRFKHVNE